MDEKLQKLLAEKKELAEKLLEALEAGRFFITITYQQRKSPDDASDLHHYWMRNQFMSQDCVPALKHIANDFNAKENPTAEVKGDEWV